MHAAKVESSARLTRVLRALKRKKKLSTRELIQRTDLCAINSIVSELRQNGYQIKCTREGMVWFYELER